jgi:formylglycine-generating enzyme required for sulfatase activity
MRFLLSLLLVQAISASNFLQLGKISQLQDEFNIATAELFTELAPEPGDTFSLASNPNRPAATFLTKRVRKKDKLWIIEGRIIDKKENVYAGMSLWRAKSAESKEPNTFNFAPARSLESIVYNQIDGSKMILIPEGPFIYGSQIIGSSHYTSPLQKRATQIDKSYGRKKVMPLSLESFYIDETEISRQMYLRYLKSTGKKIPEGLDISMKMLPFDNATYQEAIQYCSWAGKSLPSELQWEKAARGTGLVNEDEEFIAASQDFPIGPFFDPVKCNTLESPYKGLLAVDQVHDLSPFNVKGLCGNAAEWTSSWYIPYRGNTSYNKYFGRRFRVVRGGSYQMTAHWAKAYERLPAGLPLPAKDKRAGFRCIKAAN